MFQKGFTIRLLLLALFLVQGSAIWSLVISRNYHREKSENYKKEISDIKSAGLLTENLLEYNGELARDRDVMQKEIEGAPSYTDPLPADVVLILDRLRTSGTAYPGAP